MLKIKSYMIFVLITLLFLQSCKTNKGLPDLRESYSYKDKRPFGTSVAYTLFKNTYANAEPQLTKKNFGENYQWDYDTASLYFNISRNFYVTERDADALLDFAYKGNTIFISSGKIDPILTEKINFKQNAAFDPLSTGRLSNTSVQFKRSLSLTADSFSYFYYSFNNSFSGIDEISGKILGNNHNDKPNLFFLPWGRGRFFFHSEPRALSNYFLLTGNNYKYMEGIMQMLPAAPENIYWDDHYGKKNFSENGEDDFSTFGTLMKYPALSRAFFIALALLILYILFNSKRRQRVVPVIKLVENSSIAFAEAIAGLYLNKKDNKLIADKMITYFNEHLRTKYFLNINVQDADYADMLSRKSGVPIEITQPLVENIKQVNATEKINEQQLLLLNGLIEKFLNNKV